MVVIVLAAIYGKAIFIIDKQMGKRDKCTLSRSTTQVAEMTTDKHVSKSSFLRSYFTFILTLIIMYFLFPVAFGTNIRS